MAMRLVIAESLTPASRHRQALRAQELRIEQLRLVARAAVGEDRHHRVPRSQLLRHTHRGGDVDAGRSADRQSFMDQHVEDVLQRLGVGDLLRIVDRRAVHVGGDARIADALGDRAALDLQVVVLHPAVEPAALAVGQHDPHLRIALLQRQRHAGQRAAGAAGAGERVHLAFRLLPDLGPGVRAVALAVGEVVELVGPHAPVSSAIRRETCT